jgi:ribosomal protein L37AE/L43A
VAADQLEQALTIMALPIPQNIIDEMKELEAAPAYEIPRCPRCKAEDPTLESVEPTNNWLCESCGHTWSDPMPDPVPEN